MWWAVFFDRATAAGDGCCLHNASFPISFDARDRWRRGCLSHLLVCSCFHPSISSILLCFPHPYWPRTIWISSRKPSYWGLYSPRIVVFAARSSSYAEFRSIILAVEYATFHLASMIAAYLFRPSVSCCWSLIVSSPFFSASSSLTTYWLLLKSKLPSSWIIYDWLYSWVWFTLFRGLMSQCSTFANSGLRPT